MTKCSKVLLKYVTIFLDMKARNVFLKKKRLNMVKKLKSKEIELKKKTVLNMKKPLVWLDLA